MNHAYGICEDMKRSPLSLSVSVSISSDRRDRDTVVCPKPRRLGILSSVTEPIRPLRCLVSHDWEPSELEEGTDLLDVIHPKGGCDDEPFCAQLASSPPFFSGSPPSRASNPLIHDVRFRDEMFSPVSPLSVPVLSGLTLSPSSSARMGGCVRASFGNNPTVRVEGFDCLDRDGRNCSIPTLA